MSFTDTVKGEITHVECRQLCCARAALSAALLLSGGVSFRGHGKYGLSLVCEQNSVSRYYFPLIKRHFSVVCEIRTLRMRQLGERMRYELIFPEESVPFIMDELRLLDESALFGVRQSPDSDLFQNDCCYVAFFKSAFLIAGSISRPEKEYSLTIAAGNEELANFVAKAMGECGMNAGVSPRKAQFVTYLKSADDISTFLAFTGAHTSVLSFENTRIIKQIRNQVNRVANCDNNNIERTLKSAQSQIDDIELVMQNSEFEKLPATIREIAFLRLNDPNATMTELGEMCSPPIGKSGVNNRLRRISEIAKALRDEQ